MPAKKTATILVGSEVGGNSDLFARLIARHFERVIPSLRIEIKNVPQASGALAAKTLQSGPTDGTMLLSSSTGLLSAQVEGDESVQYDLAQWAWLGRLATETRLLNERGDEGEALLSPATLDALNEAAERALAEHADAGYPPVLLTSPGLRAILSRLLRRNLPRLAVIAYAEVPADKMVQVATELTIGEGA